MKKTLTIMAIDPGVTTGIALGTFANDDESRKKILKERIAQGEFEGWEMEPFVDSTDWHIAWEIDIAKRLLSTWQAIKIESGGCKLMAIEDFILRPHIKTSDRNVLSPVRITSALLALLEKNDRVIMQSPSTAKSYATDIRIKEWGLWKVGSPHIRDAYRHMALALLQKKSLTPPAN